MAYNKIHVIRRHHKFTWYCRAWGAHCRASMSSSAYDNDIVICMSSLIRRWFWQYWHVDHHQTFISLLTTSSLFRLWCICQLLFTLAVVVHNWWRHFCLHAFTLSLSSISTVIVSHTTATVFYVIVIHSHGCHCLYHCMLAPLDVHSPLHYLRSNEHYESNRWSTSWKVS